MTVSCVGFASATAAGMSRSAERRMAIRTKTDVSQANSPHAPLGATGAVSDPACRSVERPTALSVHGDERRRPRAVQRVRNHGPGAGIAGRPDFARAHLDRYRARPPGNGAAGDPSGAIE